MMSDLLRIEKKVCVGKRNARKGKKCEEAMRMMVEAYEKWMNYVFVGVEGKRVAVWMWKAMSAN